MTDEQHMQKAREVGSDIRVALALRYSQEACWIWSDLDADTEMDAIIASALSEAYRSGVEAERAVWAERFEDKVGGLEADLDSAVEVAWNRGAIDWVQANYPKMYERLFALRKA